jgi:hypothetical protein
MNNEDDNEDDSYFKNRFDSQKTEKTDSEHKTNIKHTESYFKSMSTSADKLKSLDSNFLSDRHILPPSTAITRDKPHHNIIIHPYKNERYEGEVDEFYCRNGYGIYQYPNNDIYEGEFDNGLRHGEGEYTYADGSKYIGSWRRDMKHGKGNFKFDQYEFDGDWEDDKLLSGFTYKINKILNLNSSLNEIEDIDEEEEYEEEPEEMNEEDEDFFALYGDQYKETQKKKQEEIEEEEKEFMEAYGQEYLKIKPPKRKISNFSIEDVDEERLEDPEYMKSLIKSNLDKMKKYKIEGIDVDLINYYEGGRKSKINELFNPEPSLASRVFEKFKGLEEVEEEEHEEGCLIWELRMVRNKKVPMEKSKFKCNCKKFKDKALFEKK